MLSALKSKCHLLAHGNDTMFKLVILLRYPLGQIVQFLVSCRKLFKSLVFMVSTFDQLAGTLLYLPVFFNVVLQLSLLSQQ